MTPALEHPLLTRSGVRHGFCLRGDPGPPGLRRPRQVHGAAVTTAAVCAAAGGPPEADAVLSGEPDVAVGIVTADCVPVLLAAGSGRAVAAVHAGWRGLALGVIGAGVRALRDALGGEATLVAAIGPHIGACCYEVDAPVIEALRPRFGASLGGALQPTRAGHALLDLSVLARESLRAAGLASGEVGFCGACTRCDPARFHSYRRDGAGAGRLVHFIAPRRTKG